MMESRPAVRARHLKMLLASIDVLPEERGRAIRQRLDPAALRAAEEASGVEWVPLEPNLTFHRSLHAVLGPGACEQFHRQHFLEAFRSPLLRAFTHGAAALYGADPASWMRFLPAGWSALYRDSGSWIVEHEEKGLVAMLLRGAPKFAVTDRVWPAAVAASLSAAFDLARARGAVTLCGLDPAAREARFEMRWAAAAGRPPLSARRA